MKFIVFLLAAALAASAARAEPALDTQTFYSSDKDGFRTFKLLAAIDFSHGDPDHYFGIAAQRARYSGPGFGANYNRVYLNYASSRDNGDGANWKWNTLLGGDGHTLLGNAEIYREQADGSRSHNVFTERDIIETRDGTRRGLYYTLLGLSEDFTLGARWSATGVLAGQHFTGGNTRPILKGRLGYLLVEDWGLSAQLRARWFHDSRPQQYDYFSPRWYGEWVPALQLRRFYGGHQFRAALGYGRQRSSGSDWTATRLAELSWTSPKRGQAWYAKVNLGYTNTPVNTGYAYAYRYVNAQLIVPLP
jgi:hypothetical protein